jgi:transketolase
LDSEDGEPEVILIATGSEVALAMDSATVLRKAGRKIRVVSMPSSDVFDAQDESYRESVLPQAVSCRIAIEAGVSDGWRKYVGLDGAVIGLDRFGESAPAEAAFEYFGFTVENIVNQVNAII